MIGQKAVKGHLPTASATRVQHPAAEHDVGFTVQDGLYHLGDRLRVVLPVGVQHDDDVCTDAQSLEVASLLVAAVANVVREGDYADRQLRGDFQGGVDAVVVDEQHLGHDISWDGPPGASQCASG